MRVPAAISIALMALTIATSVRADGHGFTIGTGEANGNYYSVGGALCRMVNRDEAMRCLTQQTSGSIDNLYALDLGDVDFAIMQADVQAAAFTGSERIADGPYHDLRSVFALYDEMLAVVVRADADIEGFGDLRGRRVHRGSRNSGTRWTFDTVLQAHGIGLAELAELDDGGAGDRMDDLCAGRIDALAMVSGHPSNTLARLADTCLVALISPDPRAAAAMAGSGAGYMMGEIPGGLYNSLPSATATIGTKATVVTLVDTDPELVGVLMEDVFFDLEAFRRQQIVLGDTSPSRDGLTAPLHPAAQWFFDQNARVQ